MFSKNQKVFLQNIKFKPFSLFVVWVIFCGQDYYVNGQVPLTEFMPYTASEGAKVISLGDTDNHEVRLGFTFKYYGQEYTYVYINSNGYVYFNWTSWDNFVGCNPLYTDLYPSAGGTVSYKISQDKELLLILSNDMSKSSSEVQNVSLTNLFAATWNNVAHRENNTFRNTFQAVLTTDGFNSFVLFYYNKVEIPPDRFASAYLTNNAGDVPHNLASKKFRNMSAMLSGSNINVPGKWVFQVNSCASLKHYEKTISNKFKASTLRQGALLIPLDSSHCISISNSGVVNCKFESEKEVSSTTGILFAGKELLICPMPLFLTSGEFLVEVVVTITHNSIVMTRILRTKLFVEKSEDLPEPQTVASIFQTETFLGAAKITPRQVKLFHPSRHISIFGNVPLLLKLPFMPQFLFNVKCNFIEANNNFKSSNGMLVSREQLLVICPVPFLSSVGIVNFQVQLGYDIFYGVFYAAPEKDFDPTNFAQISETSSTDEKHALLHVSLNPAWKSQLLASDVIDFFNVSQTNYQIVFYNYDGNHWEEIFTSNCFPLTEYVNVSLPKKELLEIFPSANQIAVGIRETFETSYGQKVSGVTFLRMKDAYWLLNDLKELSGIESSESGENAECKTWFDQDDFSTNTDMSCPKTVTQARRDWRFIENDNKTCFQMSEKNPLAFTQAIASDSGKGVLCLYDPDGNLSNQSHAQKFSSTNRKNYWANYFYDTIPFMHCCRSNSEEANCKTLYLTKRAQEDGSHYAPSRFALAVSTGKIFPFDSEMYRILTFGEFWALKYTNDLMIKRRRKHSFQMQVRVEQYNGVDKKAKPVPVITGVAILDQNGHKNFSMQVFKDKNKPEMAIRTNKKELYTIPKQNSSQIFYFDQATIEYFSSSEKLLVTFQSGFSVLVTSAGENEMGMNLIASATAEQFQNSSGFLTEKSTHGHTEELDSVKETEIVDLINTELVYANESLFAYQTDKPYSYYYRPNVTLKLPDTIDTGYEMQSNCQANPMVEGMMDLVLTGSVSVANSTRDMVKYFVELSKDS